MIFKKMPIVYNSILLKKVTNYVTFVVDYYYEYTQIINNSTYIKSFLIKN